MLFALTKLFDGACDQNAGQHSREVSVENRLRISNGSKGRQGDGSRSNLLSLLQPAAAPVQVVIPPLTSQNQHRRLFSRNPHAVSLRRLISGSIVAVNPCAFASSRILSVTPHFRPAAGLSVAPERHRAAPLALILHCCAIAANSPAPRSSVSHSDGTTSGSMT